MLKINQIKLPVGQNEQQLEKKIRKILNLPKTESFTYEIIKKISGRKKKTGTVLCLYGTCNRT